MWLCVADGSEPGGGGGWFAAQRASHQPHRVLGQGLLRALVQVGLWRSCGVLGWWHFPAVQAQLSVAPAKPAPAALYLAGRFPGVYISKLLLKVLKGSSGHSSCSGWVGACEPGGAATFLECVRFLGKSFFGNLGEVSADGAVGLRCPSQRCWCSRLSWAVLVNVSSHPHPLLWAGDLCQHSSASEFHRQATLCNTSLAQEGLWHSLSLVQS